MVTTLIALALSPPTSEAHNKEIHHLYSLSVTEASGAPSTPLLHPLDSSHANHHGGTHRRILSQKASSGIRLPVTKILIEAAINPCVLCCCGYFHTQHEAQPRSTSVPQCMACLRQTSQTSPFPVPACGDDSLPRKEAGGGTKGTDNRQTGSAPQPYSHPEIPSFVASAPQQGRRQATPRPLNGEYSH